jgi:SAM-dependent methyltransferase
MDGETLRLSRARPILDPQQPKRFARQFAASAIRPRRAAGFRKGLMSTVRFYDQLAPFYHLLFPQGFDTSIVRHAEMLDDLICQRWSNVHTILDVSCGIGTQALGLARRGYQVTASDLSPGAIRRARQEARERDLTIAFSVADMRQAYDLHGRQFDVVLSADNSIPHLLSDDEVLAALSQLLQCCRPGGGCIISVRDCENEDRTSGQVRPYGLRTEGDDRYLIFQVWDFQGAIYDLSMYVVRDSGMSECETHVMRTRYYAIGIHRLMELMQHAGFTAVQRLDNVYVQPVIVGTREQVSAPALPRRV